MNLNERIEDNRKRIAKLEAIMRDAVQADIVDHASLITELQEVIGLRQIEEADND